MYSEVFPKVPTKFENRLVAPPFLLLITLRMQHLDPHIALIINVKIRIQEKWQVQVCKRGRTKTISIRLLTRKYLSHLQVFSPKEKKAKYIHRKRLNWLKTLCLTIFCQTSVCLMDDVIIAYNRYTEYNRSII